MAVFTYKAIDTDQSHANGTIVADSPRQARDALFGRGLIVHEVSTHASAGHARKPLFFWGARHKVAAALFIRELATLLGVGIPLLEALDSLARQRQGRFHSAVLTLRERVASGAGLAEAMKEQPLIFDDICIAMTEVGESAGSLDTVLDRLADFKERAGQLKDRVLTALLYPAIVLTMAVAVSIFLMTFVVPKLLSGLVEAGQPIPLPTRIVKAFSDFLLDDWWMLLLGIAILFTAVTAIYRTARGRLLWHRLQLRLPIAGSMILKQSILRMAIVISTLMRSGIVFLGAVRIAARSTQNLAIRDALFRCEAAVQGGQDISKALEETGVFPNLVIQIFSVGQQSGRLEEMLERLAADYDRQITTASQRLTAALEPILILFLVVIVGLIAFATVLPMLEAGNVF